MLKNFLYLTILFYLFSFSKPLSASHVLGGEISWRCVNDKYVFFLQVYRDCSGTSLLYENESLEIFGTPLPKNASNQIISSINLTTDTSFWLQNNEGQLSPECDTNSSLTLKCSSGDRGTIQAFYYKSAPIDLKGTPPESGWRFGWEAPCCRPNNTNIEGGASGVMTLRAMMFPDKNDSDIYGCIDNSPELASPPAYAICKGQYFTYNPNGIDRDLDSIVYAWDRTYNSPVANPTPVAYAAGYNYNNTTPDTAFNSKNIAASLNPHTGNMKMSIHSGSYYNQYLTVVRVDAYREGVKIASVYRESPIMVIECPQITIDSVRGKVKNKPPLVYIDGEQREDTLIDVQAGQKIQLPIKIVDHDYSGFPTSPKQKITVVPSGFMFSRDFADPEDCRDFQGESFGPCAYLNNQAPKLNANVNPPRREITNRGEVNSNFIWDTQCHHLSTLKNDSTAQKEVIYNFVLKTFDDHCPLPAESYATISVRLRKASPLNEPIMKGASVGLDGKLTYSWAPPLDSANAFSAYKTEIATPTDGNSPAFYQTLQDSVNNYHQQRKEDNYSGIFTTKPNNQPNILFKRPGTDWHIRMQTISGCEKDTASPPSEAVRIMEVEATPSGSAPFPKRSSVTLDWNRPKPINSNTYSHYLYESPTHFYIWENDSIELNGGEYIEGENIESNWYLRGDTNVTNYTLNTNVCNARVGFRVEARDTVVVWAQGSNMRTGDRIDTLTFSTFSTIDTTLMRDAGSLPKPEFDTIIVRENGDLYFKIDRSNSGPVARYKLYKDGDTIPIADIDSKVDSFLYNSFDANNSIGSFVLESESECDQITLGKSSFYTNILLKGELLEPKCSLNYELSWNTPSGFTSPIHHYELYIDSANTGFKLAEKITDANTTSKILKVIPEVNYSYKIIAVDQEKSVNISGTLNYTAPNDLRSFDIVPAPELLCANVEINGEVTLSFIPPKDTTNNGLAYKFEYKQSNSNFWKQFDGSANVDYENDNTVTITGIDALSNDYDFRAKTISGCDGSTPSEKWSTLSNEGIQVMDQFLDYLYVDGKKAISYQWIDCNSNHILPIDTLEQFVPSDTGTFAIYIEYEDCSDTSVCYTVDHLFDTAVTQLNYNTLQSEESSAYYQWIDCRADTLIPGATQRNLVAQDTGYYAVIMRAYGYSDTSECVPLFTVGIDKLNFSENVNFYPNPTNGTLTIKTGSVQKNLQIKIRNIHGQLVQEEQFVNQGDLQLQLNGKPGIYFIELMNGKGERANVKVVKR